MSNGIIAIIGATATGKSALALEIAAQLIAAGTAAEILSVDSMQVYRGMDIGTAKPSREDRQRVRHHLIDVCDPTEEFTVARFVGHADRVIAEARAAGRVVIAVGGTPLYFKSLFEGIFDGPAADESLRARLRDESGEWLHDRLKKVDPAAAERIHANDVKRLVRALEVFELTGRPISELQGQWGTEPRLAATWVGLTVGREVLNRRINARVKGMIEAGWLEEVRGLLERYGALSATAKAAAGYAQLIEVAQRRAKLEDAVEQIKIDTRQLSRRQIKWFRRFAGVQWLDAEAALAENAAAAIQLTERAAGSVD
jgi:tRNA dimethylallyltransferase